MIDRPGRAVPRFPQHLEPAVRQALRDRLSKYNLGFGYASAACGADILFLETLLESGGEAHVLLPYDRELFKRDSVEIIPNSQWGERYEQVLAKATQPVQIAWGQRSWAGSVTYEYANRMLQGLASIRAQQLDTELVPIAVWDGHQGDGPGGTADTVKRWRDIGYEVEIVDVTALLRTAHPESITLSSPAATPPPPLPQPPFPREIRAMLFADTKGYSALTEEQLPVFAPHFLGHIAQIVSQFEKDILLKRTAGDGLFLVFSSVAAAGDCALALQD
jgi:hypothetical protein